MAEKGIFFRLARKDEYYAEMVQFVADLRKEGRLIRVLKQGLLLMWDLMNGNTDELLRQFPFVREAICPPLDSSDMDEMKARMARMEKLLQQQAHPMQQDTSLPPPPAGYPSMKHSNTAPAPTIAVTAAAPVSAEVIADNFLAFIQ